MVSSDHLRASLRASYSKQPALPLELEVLSQNNLSRIFVRLIIGSKMRVKKRDRRGVLS